MGIKKAKDRLLGLIENDIPVSWGQIIAVLDKLSESDEDVKIFDEKEISRLIDDLSEYSGTSYGIKARCQKLRELLEIRREK